MRPETNVIDLSVAVSTTAWEPEPIACDVTDHRAGADKLGRSAQFFSKRPGWRRLLDRMLGSRGGPVDHLDFPDAMGLSQMTWSLSTHTGTHVDAPFHYGWRSHDATTPDTIDRVPLHRFIGNGIRLDFSRGDEPIDAAGVERRLDREGVRVSPGDIVLFDTGASRHLGTRDYFNLYRGIETSAIHWLLDRGVYTMGTDAFSFDEPFLKMLDAYKVTGDPRRLWPAHVLGRDRPYIQIERLTNLDKLPGTSGFTVCCFPIKLEHSDAAWSRVVALVEDG